MLSRTGLVIGIVFLVASCGFRPLYAPLGDNASETDTFAFEAFSKTAIGRIREREGQFLRNELVRLLHPSGKSRENEYYLSVTISESKTGLAVRRSSDATRASLTVNGSYSLIAKTSEAKMFSGTVSSTSGYNIFESEFQTLSAENNARERALRDVAHLIRLRLATDFATRGRDAPAAGGTKNK